MRYFPLQINNPDLPLEVEHYWQDVLDKGLLKYRMPEVKDPDLDTVAEMISKPWNICFVVWDNALKRICADVMLNNFQGATAMIHFSIHPSYRGYTKHLSRQTILHLFSIKNQNTGHRLASLVGLTPVTNRLAIKHLKNVGFSVKTVLSSSFILAYDDFRVVDGILSELRLEDTYTWELEAGKQAATPRDLPADTIGGLQHSSRV